MNKKTPFGIFVSILRVKSGETQIDMAKKLGVSTSFLSSLESGCKSIPTAFRDTLIDEYNLTKEEIFELDTAIRLSKTIFKFKREDLNEPQIELLIFLENNIDKVDKVKKDKIIKIIKENK